MHTRNLSTPRFLLTAAGLVALALTAGGCRTTFWSPDGKRLLIAHAGNLYRFDVADGAFRVLVPGHPGRDEPVAPSWSPDGKQVACLMAVAGPSGRAGTLSLEVLGAETGRRQELLKNLAFPFPDGKESFQNELVFQCYTNWSPDGKHLLLTHKNAATGPGEGSHCVWRLEPRVGTTPARVDAGWELTRPVWSPDGQRVAAAGMRRPGTGSSGVVMFSPQGTGHRMLWSPPDGGDVFACQWSADGKRLGVIAGPKKANDQEEDSAEAWILSVDTGQANKLGRVPSPVWATSISPALDSILYVREKEDPAAENSPAAAVVRPPGVPTFLRPIGVPAFGGSIDTPSFSPDGKFISALYGREGGGADLWVMSADSASLKSVPVPAR